jgi:acyl-CoA synthetase (AMP-forming)/AMP-acid ligase II
VSHDLADAANLVAQFRHQMSERPQAPATGFLAAPDDPVNGIVSWSFEALDRQARVRAGWLQSHLPTGSRVLLLHPNGLEFAAAFLGCLYAGMIAVPAPLPGRYRHHRHRVAAVAADADAGGILTTSAQLAEVRQWAADSGLGGLPTVAGEELTGAGDDWRPVPLERSTTALLQYTSGSTGDPKGVVLSHDNVLFNMAAAVDGIGWPAEMRLGGWLPLYHDMGLNGEFLFAVLRGGFSLLMDPAAFVRRPLRWLQMLDAQDINVTFAPNFAYQLCVNKIDDRELAGLDLSRWRVAGNGSEPVDPGVLAAFTKKFAAAGFREDAFAPVYGLAESTVYVSGRRGRRPRIQRVDLARLARGEFAPAAAGQPIRDVVSCGPPSAACEIQVVDPTTRAVLPPGRLGEIWLRGRSVSAGYWRRPSTGEVFGATTADGQTGYLRTGDLGAFEAGELYVHGRLKDMLIVRGRNVYPQDIEQELRTQLPELGQVGAVFAGPDHGPVADDDQSVVVAHEVTALPADRLAALATQIRFIVARDFGVRIAAVLLLRPGTVLRTTSGKVQRSAMRERFVEGTLTPLYQDPPGASASDPAVP